MPSQTTRKLAFNRPPLRTGFLCSLAAAALLIGSQSLQTAIADGETRTISMHHLHTGEDITITYKKDGRYDPAALKKLDWFLRDWREHKETHMDPRLYDLLWEVYREVGGSKPIQIVCGYRDEHTNSMLRNRSKGVAKSSQHMLGKAIDFFIPDTSLEKEREVGLRLQRGGVGYYPTSGSPFVHMDVGGIRHWPRMTREQLAHVFPDGRTVHIPTDGRPMKNYALALADVEQRGSAPSQLSLTTAEKAGMIDQAEADSAENAAVRKPNLLARIFGSPQASEQAEATADSQAAPPPKLKARLAAAKLRSAAAPVQLAMQPIPLPRQRPGLAPVVVAAALPIAADAIPWPRPDHIGNPATPRRTPAPVITVAVAYMVPSEIINFRGYWSGPQEATVGASDDAAEPATTASIPPSLMFASAQAAPIEGALAYAATPVQHELQLPRRPAPHSTIIRSPQAATSTAVKVAHASPSLAQLERFNPWLAAVTITPSVRNDMSATQYGARDLLALRIYLEKPGSAVTMAFSEDPYPGLSAERFQGSAVVFLGTTRFAATASPASQQTASLQ